MNHKKQEQELKLAKGFQIKIFACSDHHFYHRNIIKYANRPFDVDDEDAVQQNAKLIINRHNSIVTNDDVVLMIGDLSAGLRYNSNNVDNFKELLKLLNGRKILIRGNHDYEPDEFYLDAGFESVHEYLEIDEFFISHYPCYESRWICTQEKEHLNIINKDNCKYVIHGHIHNKNPNDWEPDGLQRINVCIDYKPNNYYPLELNIPKIQKYFKNLKI